MIILVSVTVASLAVFAFPYLKGTGLFLGYWPMFGLGLGLYCLLDRNITLHRFFWVGCNWISISFMSFLFIALLILAYNGLLVQSLERIFIDASFGFAVCSALAFWLLAALELQISSLATSGHVLVRLPLKAGVFLGSISYSVYLLHPKIYQLPQMAIRQLTTPDNPAYIFTIIIGTIGLSWMFYWCFERPFIGRLKIRPV